MTDDRILDAEEVQDVRRVVNEKGVDDLADSHEALRGLLYATQTERDALRENWRECGEALRTAQQVRHMRAEAAEARVTALTLALRDVLTLTDSPVLHAERVAAARAVLAADETEPTDD